MDQFFVPNRLKAIKKTSSGLIVKSIVKKKFKLYLRALFLKTFLFFCFLKSPRDKSLFISGLY